MILLLSSKYKLYLYTSIVKELRQNLQNRRFNVFFTIYKIDDILFLLYKL